MIIQTQFVIISWALLLFSLTSTNAAHIRRKISEEHIQHMLRNVKATNSTDTPEVHSGGGAHNPSYELHIDTHSYKPEGFVLESVEISNLKTIVAFEFPDNKSVYDKYTFQIRFFGHVGYVTDMKTINKTDGVNEIVLHDFLDDKYVVCVTFFSSDNSVPPLSTRDMCIDVLIGEDVAHASHSATGLLSPLLLAVAAVLLIFIAIVDILKKQFRKYQLKRAESPSGTPGRKMSLAEKTIRRMSVVDVPKNKITKNDLSQVFHQQERRGSLWEGRAQGRLVRVSESEEDLGKSFRNAGFINDEHEEHDEETKTSLDTLKHLLNSKPWMPSINENFVDEESEPTNQKPSFFLKTN